MYREALGCEVRSFFIGFSVHFAKEKLNIAQN